MVTLVVGGCIAHEAVGRPPSLDEIERINAYAQEHGDLRVEYVTPLPPCAAGSCGRDLRGRPLPDEITMVVSSDERETVVEGQDGQTWKLETSTMVGASARNRARGAAVGAIVGVAIGLALTAALVGLAESGAFRESDPSAPPTPPTSVGDVAKVGLLLSLTQGLGWAFWGYVIGGRTSFDFHSGGLPSDIPNPSLTKR